MLSPTFAFSTNFFFPSGLWGDTNGEIKEVQEVIVRREGHGSGMNKSTH